jgi:hypothetical protein
MAKDPDCFTALRFAKTAAAIKKKQPKWQMGRLPHQTEFSINRASAGALVPPTGN